MIGTGFSPFSQEFTLSRCFNILSELNLPKYDKKIIARHWAEISTHYIKNKKQVEELIDLYDAEIRYTDECIEKLFKIFHKNGITKENSFFILTADHGEEFGEHDGLGHEMKLYNEMLSVPLIFYGKKSKNFDRNSNSLVELRDIPATPMVVLFSYMLETAKLCG